MAIATRISCSSRGSTPATWSLCVLIAILSLALPIYGQGRGQGGGCGADLSTKVSQFETTSLVCESFRLQGPIDFNIWVCSSFIISNLFQLPLFKISTSTSLAGSNLSLDFIPIMGRIFCCRGFSCLSISAFSFEIHYSNIACYNSIVLEAIMPTFRHLWVEPSARR